MAVAAEASTGSASDCNLQMSVSTSSAYLDESTAKIRVKVVPWEGYQRAGLITSDELAMIKKVDRQPRAKTESILLSDGKAYAQLYLRLLKKLERVDTLQSILVLIGDALIDHNERIPLFTQASESDPELPYGPLLKALDSLDDFIQMKASQILTLLLRQFPLQDSSLSQTDNSSSSESTPLQHHQLQPFLVFLATVVQGQSQPKRDVGVQCLESLLARPESRKEVWAIPGITAGFVDTLKHNPGPQMSYQVAFCLWLLSFETEVASQIDQKFDIIPLLIKVAQTNVKEKVIRVVVATFRNLVVRAPAANLPPMLVARLLPFVKNLCARKWSDEDILEDVQFLRDELAANFQSLTTYDEYNSELISGHLSWTPVHESDDFWKDNAIKLNDADNAQLKQLINLLQESRDPTVLAVAVHDVGMYVKYCEKGKQLVTALGAKTRAMELMTHTDADVRYRALITVQRLVSQPWVK